MIFALRAQILGISKNILNAVVALRTHFQIFFENTPDSILTAPMSGKLVSINVREGEKVIAGTTLLIIEAMKMEHTIKAPQNGIVRSIYYQIDDQVLEGSEILVFESLEDSE